MVGMPLLSDGVPLSKSVQEMSINVDEPPPEFHVKDSSFGSTDSFDLSASVSVPVPVIDLSLLLSSKDEQEKLRLALESAGCFQVLYSFSSKVHRNYIIMFKINDSIHFYILHFPLLLFQE